MAIPPAFRGLLWPLGNIVTMAQLPSEPARGHGPKGDVPASTHFSGKPLANEFMDHVGVQLSTLPKLALAAYVWARLSGPSATWLASAASLDREWVLSIFLRDMLLTWVIAGGWEFCVYSQWSPFSARLRGHKLNPDLPAASSKRWPFTNPHAHDAFWSTVSTLIWSAMEVATAHAWAVGRVALPPGGAAPGDVWWTGAATLAWLATMPYWRLAHFFWLHRSMHKWFPGRAPGTGWCPDVGEWLYTWVHSLHHKSKNPTCWSGVSMHPVESSTYYTAMWLPIVVAAALGLPGVHPIVMLCECGGGGGWGGHVWGGTLVPVKCSLPRVLSTDTKMDLHFAALIGHDGVGYPGAASQAHWLHHSACRGGGPGGRRLATFTHPFFSHQDNMDCNYGENYAPFDWLMGSWAKDEDDFIAMKSRWATSGSAKGASRDSKKAA